MSDHFCNVQLTLLEKELIRELNTLSHWVNEMNPLLIKANGYGIHTHNLEEFHKGLRLVANRGMYRIRFLTEEKFNKIFIKDDNFITHTETNTSFPLIHYESVFQMLGKEVTAYVSEKGYYSKEVILTDEDKIRNIYPILFFDEETLFSICTPKTYTDTELRILTSKNYE